MTKASVQIAVVGALLVLDKVALVVAIKGWISYAIEATATNAALVVLFADEQFCTTKPVASVSKDTAISTVASCVDKAIVTF